MLPTTVVETPTFENKAGSLLDEKDRRALIDFLAWNPEAGDILAGTGGVRKVRWARENEGTSGGFRVIYYYYNLDLPLFALTLYPKSGKDNLTKAERNAFKKVTENIAKQYKDSLKSFRRR